ncbi:hypothetical protein G3T37_04495 [Galbitalea soli]|uniref:Integral membrane protein n=1 Tax=Galbitalea soli TaxID=1268042 RepID=A0A7C9PMB0_9MICO|nr:hypothetical protein [Galbitalea soli]
MQVLLLFVASRIVSTGILLVFAAIQPASFWAGAHPDYFSFAGFWDAGWYRYVAQGGYPATLPLTADGHINQNAWAFLPAYPVLVDLLTAHTIGLFFVVGSIVSALFLLGSALLFRQLLVPRVDPGQAMFAVALLLFAPLSPIFQVAYAESMQLFFLMGALLFLQRRRYGLMMVFVAVMSFTRPTGLPFALALGLYAIARWLRRAEDPFPPREVRATVLATLGSAALGYAWPAIAGLATGVPNAYTATELSWRQPYVGWTELVPFTPWIQGANWWIPQQPWGIVLLVVLIAGFAGALLLPAVRRLGPELRIWTASWVIYLLAVFFPQSSVFRLLIPAFPLLGAIAAPRSRAYRAGMIVLATLGQIAWVYACYWYDGYDWTPP